MEKKKAWVWFKGGLNGGSWVSGFIASNDDLQPGVLIEKADFVSCRVPEWRVSFDQPEHKKKSPEIPNNPTWKYI
ncbi:hypothetical protein [Prochlorococcus sp. MIT 1307]|uniref:hypothetical protein n=1 Tax=Prochlorococcus sp. MIT 1307 TaxID=3096219 RepID=UPI002A74E54D|nr:hypothetical protein [Prochlorococcus sp. MIT 1307]